MDTRRGNESGETARRSEDTEAAAHTPSTVEIVFDGPPGAEPGRFIEVEQDGKSISFGRWVDRGDGTWALRLPANARLIAAAPDLLAEHRRTLAQLKRMAKMTAHLTKTDPLAEEIRSAIKGTLAIIARAEGRES